MKKTTIIVVLIILVVIGGAVVWAVTRPADEEGTSIQQTSEEENEVFDSSEFTKDKKEKKITGEVHSIIDMGIEYTANYDRVTFSFASNASNQTPGYIAELSDKVISIIFLDTTR